MIHEGEARNRTIYQESDAESVQLSQAEEKRRQTSKC